jgi:chromate transporter
MNFYLQSFLIFLKIGLFTIGGGYAMVPLIQDEIVDKRKWIDKELMIISGADHTDFFDDFP